MSSNPQLPPWAVFACAGLGASVAEVRRAWSVEGGGQPSAIRWMRPACARPARYLLHHVARGVLHAPNHVHRHPRAVVDGAGAQIATLPIDTSKVRLQLQQRSGGAAGEAAAVTGPRLGMVGMARKIAVEEGVGALYKGLWPAIHRQLVFASLRIGLYGQISAWFKKPGEATPSMGTRVLSGLASGAIGITVANPTDLVKVRFQSEGRLMPGQQPRYTGVFNAYATIIKQEGVMGLWTGWLPAMARNSVINATELVSYDTAKEFFLRRLGFRDGLHTHIMSGAVAGLMATIVGNPVDVVKTRVMASRKAMTSGGAGGAPQFSGAWDCVVKTMRNEGPSAFYQGVVPQFFRITGWNIVMFVTFEQLKRLVAQQLA